MLPISSNTASKILNPFLSNHNLVIKINAKIFVCPEPIATAPAIKNTPKNGIDHVNILRTLAPYTITAGSLINTANNTSLKK